MSVLSTTTWASVTGRTSRIPGGGNRGAVWERRTGDTRGGATTGGVTVRQGRRDSGVRRRRVVAAGAGVALAGGGVAIGTASPASAQAEAYPVPVVGDFTGDAREEVLLYALGPDPDMMVSFGRPADGVTTTRTPFSVGGWYVPLAGNFDGDEHDEILWYGFGTDADYLWDFTGPSTVSSTRLRVDGEYWPVAGDFDGNGVDDVLWYGQGGPDHLWSFAADGSHASTPQEIRGYAVPVAGSFGTDATDDVFFHGRDDVLWDFVAGTTDHVERPFPVSRFYDVVESLDVWGDGAGGEDLLWYTRGRGPDHLWDFLGGRLRSSTPQTIDGSYGAVATGDFFGDGSDDVLFFFDRLGQGVNVWEHSVAGDRLVRDRYRLPGEALVGGGDDAVVAESRGSVTVATR
jgi:hypothetical protein